VVKDDKNMDIRVRMRENAYNNQASKLRKYIK
jgi:hypothetical protein